MLFTTQIRLWKLKITTEKKTQKKIDYNQNRKKSNKTIIYKQKLNGQNLKLAAIGATKTIII